MVYIYVLELEKGKYYIGKTNNPKFRINNHYNSNGAEWTKKYKPINVIEIIPNCDNYDEDKYTLQYMEKYGINNVRGGSFCKIRLDKNNFITLEQMINNITDKCYICGNKGHYANKCTSKEKIPTINLNEKCDCPASFFSTHRRKNCILNTILTFFDDENDDIDELKTKSNVCFRCGREGHFVASCYASKHIKGYLLKS